MSLFITSLNSGSNGNCYYIGNNDEAVLVDAGLTCRETEKRMIRLGLKISTVKAIFISHEHGDHIKGLCALAHKFSLPVYITPLTLKGCRTLDRSLIHHFDAYRAVQIGALRITAFPKYHDAEDPHSFIIESKDVTVGVFTDIGKTCDRLISHFKLCNAAFLETNYDEAMLVNGRYPIFLKNRIRGGFGHLSNKQALDLFIQHRPANMSHLLLSHLSKDNNDPEVAATLFRQYAGDTNIVVASRYRETQVYHIAQQPVAIGVVKKLPYKPMQLSFFG